MIYIITIKIKKLHFGLRHYVHACRDVAMYELHKIPVRRRSEGTNCHLIKYYNSFFVHQITSTQCDQLPLFHFLGEQLSVIRAYRYGARTKAPPDKKTQGQKPVPRTRGPSGQKLLPRTRGPSGQKSHNLNTVLYVLII